MNVAGLQRMRGALARAMRHLQPRRNAVFAHTSTDRPDARATGPAPSAARTEETSAMSARRILVVDDNRDSAESMAVLLRLQGHETETAFHGNDVLPTARRFQPHLILLDIGLPGMDGYEVARLIRADADIGKVRLAAMSGYGRDEDRARSADVGFDHHFIKPVDLAAVEKVIGEL
jgi:CheY-like chemotaxis protein